MEYPVKYDLGLSAVIWDCCNAPAVPILYTT